MHAWARASPFDLGRAMDRVALGLARLSVANKTQLLALGWRVLLRGLGSGEPVVRQHALTALELALPGMHHTLRDDALKHAWLAKQVEALALPRHARRASVPPAAG